MKINVIGNQAQNLLDFSKQFGIRHIQVDIESDITKIQDIIDSPFWPPAVNDILIANDEESKKLRASSILMTLVGKNQLFSGNFLDFGCGEGHTAIEASKFTKSLGYDPHGLFEESNLITKDINKVINFAPFSTILCYDVLDHITEQYKQIECLSIMKSLLGPKGIIFVRCHPFVSRHATHIYEKYNKSYSHLFFSHKELTDRGFNPLPCKITTRPLKDYTEIFNATGLKIISKEVIKQTVEPLFEDREIVNYLIDKFWKNDDYVKDKNTLCSLLSIQFIDFVLGK